MALMLSLLDEQGGPSAYLLVLDHHSINTTAGPVHKDVDGTELLIRLWSSISSVFWQIPQQYSLAS